MMGRYVPGELCFSRLGHVTTITATHASPFRPGSAPDELEMLTAAPHLGKGTAMLERCTSWTLTANVSCTVEP